MTRQNFEIRSKQVMLNKVLEWGFLPFFENGIDGFSISEHTPLDLWFQKDVDGPWEWKGPVIEEWQCAYGKFFGGKAGFVSLEWLPDFINWRRSVMPLERMSHSARHLLDVLQHNESMLSRELKIASGFSLSRKRMASDGTRQQQTGADADALLLQLEMATYVCIADFEYKYTRTGQRYGWGVARYCTPEAMYGSGITHCARTPEESRERMVRHIMTLFPSAKRQVVEKLI